MMLFEKLVERLKENSEVWLFLPPYHPEAYKSIVSKVPMVGETENALRSLAENTNIQIFGSYDPDRASCTEDEFFDGMHPKASCLTKIFTGLGERCVSLSLQQMSAHGDSTALFYFLVSGVVDTTESIFGRRWTQLLRHHMV
ncbi:MAG: hypothetical protein IPP84_14245 [Propionivibrio sp.]|uniref:hypothetical protein n=1 Tax=Propionivibrio sp. TaxID=2212460 RepID=UPI0025E47931|nr:hypothetical protein [Propionivibrio sp.]MBL0209053.1 hypothetical protein [Propionivibrio sp.]